MSVLDRKKCDDMVNAGGGIGVLERAQPRGPGTLGFTSYCASYGLCAPGPFDLAEPHFYFTSVKQRPYHMSWGLVWYKT